MKNIKITDTKLRHIISLADNALILGQRLGEWCGHGPVLEQDIALTNISLDLIGQARLFYQYAADISEQYKSEDDFAYWRRSSEFLNSLLVEIDNGDFAQTITRQLFFSTYTELLYEQLKNSSDERIAGIALKSLKEVKYHKRYSTEWCIRLGDGTEESNRRMMNAIAELWRYTDELWTPATYESASGINPSNLNYDSIKKAWLDHVLSTFRIAGLDAPREYVPMYGGKSGKHTEKLSYVLGELQSVARSYPDAQW